MGTTLHTQPINAALFDHDKSTRFTWLGMAGVLINARGTVLLIDPLLTTVMSGDVAMSESGYRLKLPTPIEATDVPRVDLVMYTHADDDHLGQTTARLLATRLACVFLAPRPVARILEGNGIPQERITVAEDFHTLHVDQAEVHITPALHNWQKEHPWQRGDCCGYLVRTPDGAIWHPGDTRLIDELMTYRDVDVMFFDVAAVDAHLGPEGSAKLAKSCGAQTLVAYHYGTFDLPPGSFGSFEAEGALPFLRDVQAQFLRPNPGEVLFLAHVI